MLIVYLISLKLVFLNNNGCILWYLKRDTVFLHWVEDLHVYVSSPLMHCLLNMQFDCLPNEPYILPTSLLYFPPSDVQPLLPPQLFSLEKIPILQELLQLCYDLHN